VPGELDAAAAEPQDDVGGREVEELLPAPLPDKECLSPSANECEHQLQHHRFVVGEQTDEEEGEDEVGETAAVQQLLQTEKQEEEEKEKVEKKADKGEEKEESTEGEEEHMEERDIYLYMESQEMWRGGHRRLVQPPGIELPRSLPLTMSSSSSSAFPSFYHVFNVPFLVLIVRNFDSC